MTPIQFPQADVVFAKDQPQYLPLPAQVTEDGVVTTCWQLSLWERFKVLLTGKLWLQQLTFGDKLQPQRPTVNTPYLKVANETFFVSDMPQC